MTADRGLSSFGKHHKARLSLFLKGFESKLQRKMNFTMAANFYYAKTFEESKIDSSVSSVSNCEVSMRFDEWGR